MSDDGFGGSPMQTNWDALERDNQAHRIAQLERAHAAALEENAKLRKHAEAMARTIETCMNWQPSSIHAYRADFPKEGA